MDRHKTSSYKASHVLALALGSDIVVGVVALDAVRQFLPGSSRLRLGLSSGSPDLPDGIDTAHERGPVDLVLRCVQPPLVILR